MALYKKITPKSVKNLVGTLMPIAILSNKLNPPLPVFVGDRDVDVGSRDVVKNRLLVRVVKGVLAKASGIVDAKATGEIARLQLLALSN
jgi:hypothetical protein